MTETARAAARPCGHGGFLIVVLTEIILSMFTRKGCHMVANKISKQGILLLDWQSVRKLVLRSLFVFAIATILEAALPPPAPFARLICTEPMYTSGEQARSTFSAHLVQQARQVLPEPTIGICGHPDALLECSWTIADHRLTGARP